MSRKKRLEHLDISEVLKECFPKEDILDEVKLDVRSFFPTFALTDRWVRKDVYCPYNRVLLDFYVVEFLEEDEEDDEKEVSLARIELRLGKFRNEDELLVDSDEDVDFGGSASSLKQYVELYKNGDYKDVSDSWCFIYLCELHTFYISPEFRGKGLSKYFLAIIPRLLEMLFGIKNAGIVAEINPFRRQGSLNTKRKFKSNGYQDDNKDPLLVERVEKSLKSMGFKKVSDDLNYVTDMEKLFEKAYEKGVWFAEGSYAG